MEFLLRKPCCLSDCLSVKVVHDVRVYNVFEDFAIG